MFGVTRGSTRLDERTHCVPVSKKFVVALYLASLTLTLAIVAIVEALT